MAQYQIGTVSIANNTNVVTGVGTQWISFVSVGDSFKVEGVAALYGVISVDSDTQIKISPNYAGSSVVAGNYQITTDYTPSLGLSEISAGDAEWAFHLTHEVIRKLDAMASTGAIVPDSSLTLSKLSNISANSILGNNTGSPATPIALTASQTKALLGITQSDVSGLTTTLSGKEPSITAGTTAQYYRGDKTWQTLNASAVGLGNVTNESKATMFSSPTFTGTVSGITKSMVGLGNVENTALSTWAGTTNITTAGALTVNSLSTAGQITSTIATGTAPLVITSTTKVTNLNVDQVDSFHASQIGAASSLVTTDSSGNLKLATGNVFVGLAADNGLAKIQSSNGITLGNSANSNATVLDWYEEGAWTPVMLLGATTATITAPSAQNIFTRIGREIVLRCNVTISNKNSGTGNITITGIPYTNGAASSTTLIGYVYNPTTGNGLVSARLAPSGTAIIFEIQGSNGFVGTATDTCVAVNTQYAFTLIYSV